jgi:hypothetical protein
VGGVVPSSYSTLQRRRLDAAERRAHRLVRRRRAAARLGLSTCHTSPRYYASVAEDGAYLAVKAYGERQVKVPTWTRGRVTSFTRRSRSRLLKLMSQCDREQISKSLFVTLTYPRTFPRESSTYKHHLDLFGRRLRRRFPAASLVWKLEFQVRQAPHYHLIVLGIPFLAKQWLSRVWYEVVGSGDIRHKRAGTQVQRVESYRRALSYAAKYLGKMASSNDNQDAGRFWGVIGRESLPRHVIFTRVDKRGFSRIVRCIRNLVASRSRLAKTVGLHPRWAIVRGDRGAALIEWVLAQQVSSAL